MRIVVTDHNFGNLVHEQAVAERHGHKLHVYNCQNAVDTRNAVEGANIVFNNLAPIGKDALKNMSKGALVIRYGVGVDNVDVGAATDAGVIICNVPEYGAAEVADHAAAMLLALLRHLPHYDSAIRSGKWGAKDLVPDLPAISEMTVGLLGFGRIARQLVKRLAGFECKLIACDPYANAADAKKLDVSLVGFEELIRRSNALSLHLPFTPETKHIVDERVIAGLPDRAVVVNVSRGGLIDEDALAAALQAGKLSGAGLDVFEDEPLGANSCLLKTENLILSPHAAFYSNKSLRMLQSLAAEEADRYLLNQTLRCKIN